MLGDHLIKTWAKTQSCVALSSAESEFYATLKTAQESIGLISMCKELGWSLKARLMVDASAALGVAQRLGVGRIRHLETGALWLQEQELRKVLSMNKVPGSSNCADAMTKNVSREVLERHIEGMSGFFLDGRAEKAVQIHNLARYVRQLRFTANKLRKANEINNVDEPKDDKFVDVILKDLDEHVRNLESTTERNIENNFENWKVEQSRQIGTSMKIRPSQ